MNNTTVAQVTDDDIVTPLCYNTPTDIFVGVRAKTALPPETPVKIIGRRPPWPTEPVIYITRAYSGSQEYTALGYAVRYEDGDYRTIDNVDGGYPVIFSVLAVYDGIVEWQPATLSH